MPVHVVLYQPEIPPNTGNIIRICANTGACLHLIKPLGFAWEDKRLKRAGLDYHELANVTLHESLEDFQANRGAGLRLFGLSTRGSRHYSDVRFRAGDAVMFGPETRGLPDELLARLGPEQVLRIPMQARSRSLNLANAVSVVVYEAWRQAGFIDGA